MARNGDDRLVAQTTSHPMGLAAHGGGGDAIAAGVPIGGGRSGNTPQPRRELDELPDLSGREDQGG